MNMTHFCIKRLILNKNWYSNDSKNSFYTFWRELIVSMDGQMVSTLNQFKKMESILFFPFKRSPFGSVRAIFEQRKPSHVMFKAIFTIYSISSESLEPEEFFSHLQFFYYFFGCWKIDWLKDDDWIRWWQNFESILKSSKRRQSLPVNVLPDSFNLKNGMPAIDEHSQRERDPF